MDEDEDEDDVGRTCYTSMETDFKFMKHKISSHSTTNDDPLRICLLSYRSNPHSGGQGVYLRNLSRALKDLGHIVEVVSGPPDPLLDKDIPLRHLP